MWQVTASLILLTMVFLSKTWFPRSGSSSVFRAFNKMMSQTCWQINTEMVKQTQSYRITDFTKSTGTPFSHETQYVLSTMLTYQRSDQAARGISHKETRLQIKTNRLDNTSVQLSLVIRPSHDIKACVFKWHGLPFLRTTGSTCLIFMISNWVSHDRTVSRSEGLRLDFTHPILKL